MQPTKAITAVILNGNLNAGQVAAAGILTGIILLVLGATPEARDAAGVLFDH